jgi:hypothetical protein
MIRGVNELERPGFKADPRMAAGVRLAVYSKTSYAANPTIGGSTK